MRPDIIIIRSIAYGFCNILTAEMFNDLKDTHPQKRAVHFHKTSKKLPLSIITETQKDKSSNGVTSPPPFYTKRHILKLSKCQA